jgi:hypothetical protein
VLSLHFATGVDVTIIVSKSGGRYRIQSDAFEALWLVSSVNVPLVCVWAGMPIGVGFCNMCCYRSAPQAACSSSRFVACCDDAWAF